MTRIRMAVVGLNFGSSFVSQPMDRRQNRSRLDGCGTMRALIRYEWRQAVIIPAF
ncbi:hypothetical protein [Cohnella cholangitidis]|uniref:hypothetical protein n=1 Tax=Cohnella cholangitidis TaxID=2598458 RepID=UPI0015F9DBBF|nr:hypothetical protein [Cohnella cholangitidis]